MMHHMMHVSSAAWHLVVVVLPDMYCSSTALIMHTDRSAGDIAGVQCSWYQPHDTRQ